MTKICWVSWKRICCPRSHGGLGVKDISRFNDALLAKWKWNIFHSKEALW